MSRTSILASVSALLISISAPFTVFAVSYLPGQTLNPSCLPSDPTCVVVPNTTVSYLTATSSSATSTFAGGVQVAGTASSTNAVVSGSLTLANLSGILKAIGGVITSALVNLASDVTGILGIANGGTGTSTAPTLGQILVGNGSGGYTLTSTSSLGIVASSQWASVGSTISYLSGLVGIGTTSPSQLLTLDSSSATGTILRLSNASSGGHVFDLLSTGSSNTSGAGRFDVFDSTAGAARFSIAANGNVGVGTTSPFTNFVVTGNEYTTGFYNTSSITGGYEIDGYPILQSSSTLTDLFIGQAAGNASTTGTEDIAIGYRAGQSLTVPADGATPQADTFLGWDAGRAVTTARESTFIGYDAGGSAIGDGGGIEDGQNTAVGSFAGSSITTGNDNTLVGQKAGLAISTSTGNIMLGAHGGFSLAGNDNIVLGNGVGQAGNNGLIYGDGNVLLGYAVAQPAIAGDISENVSIGNASARLLQTASGNVFLGASAGSYDATGINNTFLGEYAGWNTTGSNNIAIGNNVVVSSSTASNQLNIGNLIYGNSGTGIVNFQGNVGIGTTTPGSIFAVQGVANWSGATSTYYSTGGINLRSGCFAINGTCITSGGSGTSYTFAYPLLNTGNTISEAWGTTTANIWNQLQTFTPGFISNASSTVLGNFTATGNAIFSGTTGTTTIAAGQGFTVGNSQFVVQQGNGDVGIGTSTLSSLFDVAGSYSGNGFNTPFTVVNINPTLSGYPGSTITNTFLNIQPISSGFSNINNSVLVGLNDNMNSFFGEGGSRYTAIFQGGNVGIGTSTPISPLTVSTSVVGPNDVWLENPSGNAAASDRITFSMPALDGGYQGYIDYNDYNGGFTFNAGRNFDNGFNFQTVTSGTSQSRLTITNAGNVGIGTTTPYSRLEVFGPDTGSTTALAVINSASTTEFTVYDTGNALLAGSLTQNSDQRLKTNIQDLDSSSSLAEINSLSPVTFNWIDPNKGSVPQFGFIAQQVENVFPNLVSTTSPTALTPDGTLSLNYIDLISPMVAAIQALDREITTLSSTVAEFAQSFTTSLLHANEADVQKLCVGSTCVTPAQFQAMVAASAQSASASQSSPAGTPGQAATNTAPVIQISGANPAVIDVGASYTDLGATITGPAADLNLGVATYVNGVATSPIVIDTSAAATDTIDYVVTDQNGLTSTSSRTVIIETATNSATSTVQ